MEVNNDKVSRIASYIKDRIIYNKNKTMEHTTNSVQTSIKNDTENVGHFDIKELERNIKDNNQNWNVQTPQRITSHRKIIGRFIVFGKKAFRKFLSWYVEPTIEYQRYFNASVTRSSNELYKFVSNVTPIISTIQQEIDNFRNVTNQICEQIQDLKKLNEQKNVMLENKISLLEKQISEIKDNLQDSNNVINKKEEEIYSYIERNIEEVKNIIDKNEYRINFEIEALNKEISYSQKLDKYTAEINNKMSLMEKITEKNDLVLLSLLNNNGLAEQGENDNILFNYLEFENKFRGSEEVIKERFQVYLDHLKDKQKILDIGCGRGEMLELLKENNIDALGIDIDDDMVNHCKNKGLNVIKADAIIYLHQLEDKSLDGVFMAQVIEHLDFNYLIKLLELTKKKLTDNGVLVLESPNPLCLYIYSYGFYIDPSHIKPIHPYTLDYILNKTGFSNAQLKLLSPVPDEMRLSYIDEDGNQNTRMLNNNFKKINDILFSYQDYAIIAKK